MTASDPRRPASLFEWTGIPGIVKGMALTLWQMILHLRKPVTLQYPEEKHPIPAGYRGEHRLKKDDQGRMKCVACYMCATACPSRCIRIVAEDVPGEWIEDRDKKPATFEIDLLRCIYCGMCEEACPCDAIELTGTYNIVCTDRRDKVYDMERLLNN